MAELTINLLHDLKVKHAHQTKPPFVTGLRTGYIRAWVFVFFKVWLVLALVNGVNTMDTVEKNISLLESYISNDYSHPEVFFGVGSGQIDIQKIHHSKSNLGNGLGSTSGNDSEDKLKTSEIFYTPKVAGDVTPAPQIVFEPRGPKIQ